MKGLLYALLIIPALEIGMFIWVGGKIGPWWVILLILLTGIIGITLFRIQGMDTLNRARNALNNGKVPAEQILDGICILIGGTFLLAPGFITDTLGFILILKVTRSPIKRMMAAYFRKKISNGTIIYRKW